MNVQPLSSRQTILLGDVADVVHAVGFLTSSRAGYVTGVTLHVNGGMYMA
jgi:3-oxoacyl-[acyl-carrier protein] reductase